MNAVDTRFKVYWESVTFSPFPQYDTGAMSSVGPLEETAAPLILNSVVQSLAHVLLFGPFESKRAKGVFGWHDMGWKTANYFRKQLDARGKVDEDVAMRATAFFSNGFTRDIEGLDAFEDWGLEEHCRESSVLAIREIASFFEVKELILEKAKSDPEWSLVGSYKEINSQLEWIGRDRLWATRIAELAGLDFVLKACQEYEVNLKVCEESSGIVLWLILDIADCSNGRTASRDYGANPSSLC